MKRRVMTLLFACSMIFISGFAALAEPPAVRTAISPNEIKLRSSLKNLFSQCLGAQRTLAVKTLTGAKDLDKAQAGLNETLDKLGGVLKTYCGDQQGGRLGDLLKQYFQMSAYYAAAVKNGGDRTGITDKMQAKADEISSYLISSSPVWSKSRLPEVLKKYADLSASEIDMLGKSLGAPDAKLFSETFRKSSELADTLASGMARQFPDQFKR